MSNQNKTVEADLQLQIIRARQLLRNNGYHVDGLFHVEDVRCLTDETLDDEEAHDLLYEFFEEYRFEMDSYLEDMVEKFIEKRKSQNEEDEEEDEE